MTHVYLPFLKFLFSQSEGKRRHKPIISKNKKMNFLSMENKVYIVPELPKQGTMKVPTKKELSTEAR